MASKTKLPKGFKIIGDIQLEDYQVESIVFGMTRPSVGLFLDLGLGKTVCAIEIARYRIQFDNVKKVLVVCPATLMYNWERAIKRFSEYESLILNPIYGGREERLARAINQDYKFNIINYESLYPLLRDLNVESTVNTIYGKRLADNLDGKMKQLNFDMLIFDESSRYVRKHSAKRTRSSIGLADKAKYRLLLTATPMNHPLDIWSQFRILDHGESFYQNYYTFRGIYFKKKTFGNYSKYYLKQKYSKEFSRKIYEKSIRFTKVELDLPPLLFDNSIYIPLEGNIRDKYLEMKEKIINEIETEEGQSTITIENILTRLLKLQQITGGFVRTDKGKDIELDHKPKLDALIEEVDSIVDANESAVICCRFHKSIDIIKKQLKKKNINHSSLDGRITNKKEKDRRWIEYQNKKSIPIFVLQIESGGFGIELFKNNSSREKTQHLLIYENVWSPDVRDQIVGRIHRRGQNSTCRIVDLIVKDTIDEKIIKAIESKMEIVDMLMEEGLREFLREEE